jgi:hypothetical protein
MKPTLPLLTALLLAPLADAAGSGFSPWGVKVSNTGWIYRGEFQTHTLTITQP